MRLLHLMARDHRFCTLTHVRSVIDTAVVFECLFPKSPNVKQYFYMNNREPQEREFAFLHFRFPRLEVNGVFFNGFSVKCLK